MTAHIACSMSISDDDELLHVGKGELHIHELIDRVCRLAFQRGYSFAYAGTWEKWDDGKNMLRMLLERAAADVEPLSPGDYEPRVVNHLPWPFAQDLTAEREAQWIGQCQVIKVTETESGFKPALKNHARLAKAIAMSAARRLQVDWLQAASSADRPPLRLALHGKLSGYSGFAPGLLEESVLSLCSLCPKHRLILLGGFGGFTARLVRQLLDRMPVKSMEAQAFLLRFSEPLDRPSLENRQPDIIDLNRALEDWIDRLGTAPPWNQHPLMTAADLIDALDQQCERLTHSPIESVLGLQPLTSDEAVRLMTTSDIDEVVKLLGRLLVKIS